MKYSKQPRYAIVFPGQGSQYVGMGLKMSSAFPSALEIFKSADQSTGLDISGLSFRGPEKNLIETFAAQPCLLSANIASYSVLKDSFSKQPDFFCGHSSGEYAALVAAGVLSFAEAIYLIQIRGSLMSKMQAGKMVALIGVITEEVEDLCKTSVIPGGTLVIANLNSPNQIILSGDSDSIDSAISKALERDMNVIPLMVSGAFHSPLMQEASEKFASYIYDVQFSDANIPVVSNVTARSIISGHEWRIQLNNQITSPVLWEPSIRYLEQQHVRIFVEVGPGKILSRLIKQIIPSAITLHVEDPSSLKVTVNKLREIFDTC